jgi:hypothetical protein
MQQLCNHLPGSAILPTQSQVHCSHPVQNIITDTTSQHIIAHQLLASDTAKAANLLVAATPTLNPASQPETAACQLKLTTPFLIPTHQSETPHTLP